MQLVKRLEKLEVHHKIIIFLAIMLLTVLIARGIIYYIADPNPKIFGLELHHFDYGLILLTLVSLLMLFGKKHFHLYLILTAVSFGLIIDELWFIRKQIGGNNPAIYNPSLKYVLILVILAALIAFLITRLTRKKR